MSSGCGAKTGPEENFSRIFKNLVRREIGQRMFHIETFTI